MEGVIVREASYDSESRPIIAVMITHYWIVVAEDEARKNSLT